MDAGKRKASFNNNNNGTNGTHKRTRQDEEMDAYDEEEALMLDLEDEENMMERKGEKQIWARPVLEPINTAVRDIGKNFRL